MATLYNVDFINSRGVDDRLMVSTADIERLYAKLSGDPSVLYIAPLYELVEDLSFGLLFTAREVLVKLPKDTMGLIHIHDKLLDHNQLTLAPAFWVKLRSALSLAKTIEEAEVLKAKEENK